MCLLRYRMFHLYSPWMEHSEGGGSRTLLVVTTGDLEDVTLELVAEGLSGDLIVKHQSAIALVVRIVCGWV